MGAYLFVHSCSNGQPWQLHPPCILLDSHLSQVLLRDSYYFLGCGVQKWEAVSIKEFTSPCAQLGPGSFTTMAYADGKRPIGPSATRKSDADVKNMQGSDEIDKMIRQCR